MEFTVKIDLSEAAAAMLDGHLSAFSGSITRLAQAIERMAATQEPQPLKIVHDNECAAFDASLAKLRPEPKAPVQKGIGSTDTLAEKPGANVWTKERLEMLRVNFSPIVSNAGLLQSLNNLPGRSIFTEEALAIKYREMWGAAPQRAEPVRVKEPKPWAKPPVPEKKWTDERCQLAVNMQAQGRSHDAILEACNHLPGFAIASSGSVSVKLVELKKNGWKPTPAAPAPVASPLPQLAPAPSAAPLPRRDEWEARKAKLKEMWEDPRYIESSVITSELNNMPGPHLLEIEVIRKAAACMFLRPRKPTPPVPACFEAGGAATVEEIKWWFSDAGGDPDVVKGDERLVRAANQLRMHFNLPAFTLLAGKQAAE